MIVPGEHASVIAACLVGCVAPTLSIQLVARWHFTTSVGAHVSVPNLPTAGGSVQCNGNSTGTWRHLGKNCGRRRSSETDMAASSGECRLHSLTASSGADIVWLTHPATVLRRESVSTELQIMRRFSPQGVPPTGPKLCRKDKQSCLLVGAMTHMTRLMANPSPCNDLNGCLNIVTALRLQ